MILKFIAPLLSAEADLHLVYELLSKHHSHWRQIGSKLGLSEPALDDVSSQENQLLLVLKSGLQNCTAKVLTELESDFPNNPANVADLQSQWKTYNSSELF